MDGLARCAGPVDRDFDIDDQFLAHVAFDDTGWSMFFNWEPDGQRRMGNGEGLSGSHFAQEMRKANREVNACL